MSLPCSASHKSLDSPISHKALYGTEHPLAKGKRKTKSKHKKTSLSQRETTSVVDSSSNPKRERKGAKSTKSAAGSITCSEKKFLPTQHQTLLTVSIKSPSSHSTLARVDADSPKSSLKMRKPATAVVKSFSTAAVSAKTLLAHNPSKSRVNGKGMHKDHSVTFGVKSSASTPSNLTGSKCSQRLSTSDKVATSTSLLKSSGSELKSAIVGSTRNVCLNRKVTGVNLPPHILTPRRAFESAAERRGKGGPLTISDIAAGLARFQYRNVIVLSGAGISTASGIPDFRTPGTGLYDNLQQYKIPDPIAIFDITYFVHNPHPFFALARELYPGRYVPNPAHHFVRLLQDKGILLRNYTQNIDGLERLAGIKPAKLVEAHGSFSTASCIRCESKQDPEEVKATIFREKVPRCKHKYCTGLVKPDIVFFGEDLPQRFYSLRLHDFSHCDLLIIMGTSLEVEPFASLASLSRFDIPRVLINREVVGPFKHRKKRSTDVTVTGDLVQGVWSVAKEAGWLAELEELCGNSWKREKEGKEERGEEDVKSELVASATDHPAGTIASDVCTSTEGHSAIRKSHAVTTSDIRQAETELCSAVSKLTLSDSTKLNSNAVSSSAENEEKKQGS